MAVKDIETVRDGYLPRWEMRHDGDVVCFHALHGSVTAHYSDLIVSDASSFEGLLRYMLASYVSARQAIENDDLKYAAMLIHAHSRGQKMPTSYIKASTAKRINDIGVLKQGDVKHGVRLKINIRSADNLPDIRHDLDLLETCYSENIKNSDFDENWSTSVYCKSGGNRDRPSGPRHYSFADGSDRSSLHFIWLYYHGATFEAAFNPETAERLICGSSKERSSTDWASCLHLKWLRQADDEDDDDYLPASRMLDLIMGS